MESGFDGSGGRPKGGRDLGHGAFPEVMQDEDGAIVHRQAGEGSIECVGLGRSIVESPFCGGRLAALIAIEKRDLAEASATSAAKRHAAGVQVDAAEPGVEQVGVSQLGAVAPGRDEGLLGGVGGLRVIAEDGEGCPVHGIDPAAHEGIEGSAFTRSGSLDERSFHLPPLVPLLV